MSPYFLGVNDAINEIYACRWNNPNALFLFHILLFIMTWVLRYARLNRVAFCRSFYPLLCVTYKI